MKNCLFCCVLIAISLFLTDCNLLDEETKTQPTNISIDNVKSLLSKELTIDELYKRIGSPLIGAKGNYGNIMYQTTEGDYLFFHFKGPYVIGAMYKDIQIEGVSSNVLRLYVNYVLSEQKENRTPNKYTFEYAINKQSFSDYNDLKNYLLKLPKKYVIEYQNNDMHISPDEPFFSESQVEDFKKFCKKHDIILLWYPSG